MPTDLTTLRDFLTTQESAETPFLAALVREPSDNPPGDCAKHAEVTGRSAHAAKPYTGIDALEAATHIPSTLYAWRTASPKPPASARRS